jgi:PBP1b-binding outer membrane lipoprotein LpoB
MILKYFTLIVLLYLFVSCSSSKQNNDEKSDDNDVYVFDEVPLDDSNNTQTTPEELNYNFFVQIGAFTTRTSAQDFAEKSTNFLNDELEVKYNDKTELYAVRLNKMFNSRNEAEKIRNELRQNDRFKDAWIVRERK